MDKLGITGIITLALLCIGLYLYDLSGARHQDIGNVRSKEYTSAYYDSKHNYHPEICQVEVSGDEFRGWFTMRCGDYWGTSIGQRVTVQWVEGRMTGITHGAQAYVKHQ